MKEPFNPLPIPQSLKLTRENPEAALGSAAPQAVTPKRRSRPRAKPNSARRKALTQWQRVKDLLAEKIDQVDSDKLRRVLLGLGVAAAVAAAVVLAVKFIPATLTLLGLLGLALALKLWDRLRRLPCPY